MSIVVSIGLCGLGPVFSSGVQDFCGAPPPATDTACVAIRWPWNWASADRQRNQFREYWHGTLLDGSRDKSGFVYMRARYYDPVVGRFTQEDPIGLAGGVNLYGFAAGDPVNFSDPFGLKVCFQGTEREVADLRAATENATNTYLTLDKSNCVSRVESRGDTTFNEIRAGFQGLVNADETFGVRFTRIFSSEQISPYFVDIFEKYSALAYATRVGGRCAAEQVPWDLNQVVAHELHHHYSVPGTGRMNRSETAAVRAENVYNRAAGRPIRCAY